MKTKLFFSLCLLALLHGIHLLPAQTVPDPPAYEFTVNDGSQPGYLFLNQQPNLPGTQTTGYLLLFDGSEGHLAFFKPFTDDYTTAVADFKMLPNGRICFNRTGTDGTTAYHFFDNNLSITADSLMCVDTLGVSGTDVHELQVRANGNYYLLCTQDSTMDLSGDTIFGQPGSSNSTVRGQAIQELTTGGGWVWQWSPFAENTIGDMYDEQWAALYQVNNLLDWTHCNAIEEGDDGNILLSSRHFNQIMKIDRSGDSLLWRFGGKRDDFGTGGELIAGQHDIRQLPNGNITLYNNARFTARTEGRPMEIFLDEQQDTFAVAWEYVYDTNMVSLAMGSNRRLPNGRTITCYGINVDSSLSGLPTDLPRVIAVDGNGDKTLELWLNPIGFSYRAQYAASLGSVNLARPAISVNELPNRYILDAGVHAAYRWNTGATTRYITVLKSAAVQDYYCYVPRGDGYVSSEIWNPSSSKTAGVAETGWAAMHLECGPNPTRDRLALSVKGASAETTFDYRLVDHTGKVLLSGSLRGAGAADLDLGEVAAGIYLLRIADREGNWNDLRKIVRR